MADNELLNEIRGDVKILLTKVATLEERANASDKANIEPRVRDLESSKAYAWGWAAGIGLASGAFGAFVVELLTRK